MRAVALAILFTAFSLSADKVKHEQNKKLAGMVMVVLFYVTVVCLVFGI